MLSLLLLLQFRQGSLSLDAVPIIDQVVRMTYVSKSLGEGEVAKVSIRTLRRDANEHIKKAQKSGLPEDLAKDAEHKTQLTTDQYIIKVDKHLDMKEKEIMTV